MSNNSRKILIIEDDAELRFALVQKLKLSNFEVSEASDGEAGLQMALEQQPGLIILDIIMPRMDGLRTLEAIRQQGEEWGKDVKIVLLSNLNRAGFAAAAEEHNISGYYLKSEITLGDFVEEVGRLLDSTSDSAQTSSE